MGWSEAESYRLLGLKRGASVVDIGSDEGSVTRFKMFHVEQSEALPFADASMDGYRAVGVFHELEDPGPTIDEAYRVLRPDGRIVVGGPDFGFLLIDSSDQDLTDVVLLGLESRWVAPRAVRNLRDLLLDVGFQGPQVVVHNEVITDYATLAPRLEAAAAAAVGKALITQDDADSWLAEQANRGRRDRFLTVLPTLLISASR